MSPLFGRSAALVSMAVAIALGATSMSDIAVLAHLAPVLAAAPSGPTIRRTLDLAGGAVILEQIARARARARAHVWQLIESIPAGFPWLVIAGKVLTDQHRLGDHSFHPDWKPCAEQATHPATSALRLPPSGPLLDPGNHQRAANPVPRPRHTPPAAEAPAAYAAGRLIRAITLSYVPPHHQSPTQTRQVCSLSVASLSGCEELSRAERDRRRAHEAVAAQRNITVSACSR